MPDSPLSGSRVPDESYAADIAAIVTNAITDVESTGCPRFASTAERDQAYTAWTAATGNAIADGMSCWVADHYEDRIDGAWTDRASSSGLVKYGEESTTASTPDGSEARLAGSHNLTSLKLSTGRAYEAVAVGRSSVSGAAGIVAVTVRAARNATPTTSSAVVAEDRRHLPTFGGSGQLSFNTGGQPFQVGTAGTNWQVALFGRVVSGGGTSMSALADSRGVFSIALYDRGPATNNVPTI